MFLRQQTNKILALRLNAQALSRAALANPAFTVAPSSYHFVRPAGIVNASLPAMGFTTKKDADPKSTTDAVEDDAPPKKRRGRPPKSATEDAPAATAPVKRTRKAKAKPNPEHEQDVGTPQKMYVLKFNTPVLPFAKFPLNQNKYIQDFVAKYEQDKDKITQVIGVHFPENDNG